MVLARVVAALGFEEELARRGAADLRRRGGDEPERGVEALLVSVERPRAQSRGTAKMGAFFGPIMTFWFIAIGGAGVFYIALNPHVLLAVNPVYGIEFLWNNGIIGLVTLGGVFLAMA